MSSPSNLISPSVLSISRITIVEVVDLPQPDSPTSPTLSPRSIVKLMPSTARNTSGSGVGPPRNSFDSDLVMPWRGYSLTSFSTTSSGSACPCRSSQRGGGSRTCRRDAAGLLRQQVAQRHARPRRRAHQLARIGMRRRLEDRRRLRGLDHVALLHHDDAVAIGGGEAEIVRDQDRRHAALARQLGDEVHHGLLRGDVEAGGRLVGDQQAAACRRAPAR